MPLADIGLFGGKALKRDYLSGMIQLGIPPRESERISASLQEGKLPLDVLDTIVNQYASIARVHPDDFPWHPSIFDEVSGGLDQARIDSEAVWRQAQTYVREHYQRDLPPCAIELGPSAAVTNLLEKYVLIRFPHRN